MTGESHRRCGKTCFCDERLDDKVILITGGNAGIGLETARDFVQRGATVVIAGRDEGRLVAAAGDISSSGGSGTVDTLLLDLADFASVRAAAQKFEAKYSELNILVNNAGIMAVPRQITIDGNESQFQTNHLSHFLLTHLLLDCLKKSAPSRVINLASSAHARTYAGGVAFEDLTGEREYSAWKAYGQSKLANILFTSELARRLAGSGVDVFAVHPRVVNTNLFTKPGGFIGGLFRLVKPVFRTPAGGAQTTVHVAVCSGLAADTSGLAADTSGSYFADGVVKQPSAYARDASLAKKLWDVSLKLCGLAASS